MFASQQLFTVSAGFWRDHHLAGAIYARFAGCSFNSP
jgi:hypothetical protein